jgi:hypothetical protein
MPIVLRQVKGTPLSVDEVDGNFTYLNDNANLTGEVTTVGKVTTLSTTGVTAGYYTSANITVDNKGRISFANNGIGGTATTTVTGNVGSPTLVDTFSTLTFRSAKYEMQISDSIGKHQITELRVFWDSTSEVPYITEYGTMITLDGTPMGTFSVDYDGTAEKVSLNFTPITTYANEIIFIRNIIPKGSY